MNCTNSVYSAETMSANTGKKDELLFWIALRLVEGVGSVTYKRLIASFGAPQRVFSAPYDDLLQVEGVPEAVAGRIVHSTVFPAAEALLAGIRQQGVKVVTLSDPQYPAQLKQINDPPPFLYAKGRTDILSAAPCIAIVGTRFPSPYGEEVTGEIALALAGLGLTIVSGMAKGIDAVAHTTALAHNAPTIAVWGTGINRVYPAENRKLAHEIADKGLILSEYPLDTPPLDTNFPERNRIISGLSLAVIVTEASLNSGTMITVSRPGPGEGRVRGTRTDLFHDGAGYQPPDQARVCDGRFHRQPRCGGTGAPAEADAGRSGCS